MEIRTLGQEELEAAIDLVNKVFMRFEAPEYSDEGIATFMDYIRFEALHERMKAGELFLYGCYDKDELTGVLAARSTGHISLFFVREERQKQGIGRMLFQYHLEKTIESQIGSITVNSSPYAVPFYEKMGFAKTGKEQTQNGIRFTPMRFSSCVHV